LRSVARLRYCISIDSVVERLFGEQILGEG
jgi:hypothetical protein